MGRKPIAIDPYIEKLEQAIAIGATFEMAAMYAGISQKTFERWRAQAATAPEGSPFGQLRERLRQAEGRAAVGWLAKIEQAASNGDFRAAAWKLERRWPKEFGRQLVREDGEQPQLPDIHVHIHTARERLDARLHHLHLRHIEDAPHDTA